MSRIGSLRQQYSLPIHLNANDQLQSDMASPSHTNYYSEAHTSHWSVKLCECSGQQQITNNILATTAPCFLLASITSEIGLFSFDRTLMVTGVMYAFFIFFLLVGINSCYNEIWHSDQIMSSVSGPAYIVAPLVMVAFGLPLTRFIAYLRYKVRSQLEIEGTLEKDWLVSCCCSCCVIAQMAGHLQNRHRTQDTRQVEEADVLPAY